MHEGRDGGGVSAAPKLCPPPEGSKQNEPGVWTRRSLWCAPPARGRKILFPSSPDAIRPTRISIVTRSWIGGMIDWLVDILSLRAGYGSDPIGDFLCTHTRRANVRPARRSLTLHSNLESQRVVLATSKAMELTGAARAGREDMLHRRVVWSANSFQRH